MYYEKWDEDVGPAFQCVLMLRYCKNQRNDDSNNIRPYVRSLTNDLHHIDPIWDVIVMGIYRGVFVQNILEFYFDPVKTRKQRLHLVEIRPEFLDQPVFLASDGKSAMTVSIAAKRFSAAAKVLEWARLNMYIMRMSGATALAGKIPAYKLKYLMGHTMGSDRARGRDYQNEHAQVNFIFLVIMSSLTALEVDTCGYMFDGAENTSVTELVRSVSAERHVELDSRLSAYELDSLLLVLEVNLGQALASAYMHLEVEEAMKKELGDDRNPHECPNLPAAAAFIDSLGNLFQIFKYAIEDHKELQGRTIEHTKQSSLHTRLTNEERTTLITAFTPVFLDYRETAIHHASGTEEFDAKSQASVCVDHPLQAVTAQHPTSPRKAIVMAKLSLLAEDRLSDAGVCKYCVARGETEVRYPGHLGEHIARCQQQHCQPDQEVCSICNEITVKYPEQKTKRIYGTKRVLVEYTAEEEERCAEYDAHHEGCDIRLRAMFEEIREKLRQGLVLSKLDVHLLRYSIELLTHQSRESTKMLFCGPCEEDPRVPWRIKHR